MTEMTTALSALIWPLMNRSSAWLAGQMRRKEHSVSLSCEKERERESLFWSCSQQRPSQGRDSTSMENITINKAASSSDKEKRHREPFFLVSEIMERRQLCHEEVKQWAQEKILVAFFFQCSADDTKDRHHVGKFLCFSIPHPFSFLSLTVFFLVEVVVVVVCSLPSSYFAYAPS